MYQFIHIQFGATSADMLNLMSGYTQRLFDALSDADDWEWVGGNEHLNRWKLACGDREPPADTDACLCEHEIVENCWLRSLKLDEVRVVGNCCVKRFMPDKESRKLRCERCRTPHSNLADNKCKNCRIDDRKASNIAKKPKCAACGIAHSNRTTDLCNTCAGRCCSGHKISADKVCPRCGDRWKVCEDCKEFHKTSFKCVPRPCTVCNTLHIQQHTDLCSVCSRKCCRGGVISAHNMCGECGMQWIVCGKCGEFHGRTDSCAVQKCDVCGNSHRNTTTNLCNGCARKCCIGALINSDKMCPRCKRQWCTCAKCNKFHKCEELCEPRECAACGIHHRDATTDLCNDCAGKCCAGCKIKFDMVCPKCEKQWIACGACGEFHKTSYKCCDRVVINENAYDWFTVYGPYSTYYCLDYDEMTYTLMTSRAGKVGIKLDDTYYWTRYTTIDERTFREITAKIVDGSYTLAYSKWTPPK